MSETIIKLENISKQYRLGTIGVGTLRGDMQRLWWKITGKGDPFLKIGQENKLDTVGDEFVWALKDINLEVKQGEVLGIIGKNGAGKSTLLKILSRVTTPTTGNIKVKGRIASLLEVGTGFHPELTGRENIFLNGAILGMTKTEIKSKLDEIVDFAGIAKYVDTPVKRYSSGMYVRLAFAVAAHLEPEILIVDEVLAVGDAEFQKKAIGKMQDISSGHGRTVLFVSHNMAAVKSLCNKGVLLVDGRTSFCGDVNEVIEKYLMKNSELESFNNLSENIKGVRLNYTGEARFESVKIIDDSKTIIDEIFSGECIKVELRLKVFSELKNVFLDIIINSKEGSPIVYYSSLFENQIFDFDNGEKTVEISLENKLLPDFYTLTVGVHYTDGRTIDTVFSVSNFEVLRISKNKKFDYPYKWKDGYVRQSSDWTVIK